jgi:cytidylate kinase
VKEKFAITIARQYGSGGLLTAKSLAKYLNIAFYDKDLLLIAAKKSGLDQKVFENLDEKKRSWLFNGFSELFTNIFGSENNNGNPIFNDSLFKIQSDIIKQLARKDSAIFVGRCADYVLRNHPKCINIFIHANIEDRINRINSNCNLSENKTLKLIKRIDHERAKYYNHYTSKIWGASDSYHLCINSSVLGLDETINFIRCFIEKTLK